MLLQHKIESVHTLQQTYIGYTVILRACECYLDLLWKSMHMHQQWFPGCFSSLKRPGNEVIVTGKARPLSPVLTKAELSFIQELTCFYLSVSAAAVAVAGSKLR